MDKRNSKRQMLAEISRLKKWGEGIYDAALRAVDHVGSANYASRESEARGWVHDAHSAQEGTTGGDEQ